MPGLRDVSWVFAVALAFCHPGAAFAQGIAVDLSAYSPKCGVEVKRDGDRLLVAWPAGDNEFGRVALDLRPGVPLFQTLGLAPAAAGAEDVLLRGVTPVTFLTVGTREAPPGRPPEMSIWNTFFDKP